MFFGYFSSFAIFFCFYGILAKLGEERGKGAKALWNLCRSKYRATILHYKARLCRALQNVGTSKHVQTHAHWAKLYLYYLLRKIITLTVCSTRKKAEKNGRSTEIVHNWPHVGKAKMCLRGILWWELTRGVISVVEILPQFISDGTNL